eukprot:scaffold47_cov258-Pinguiococcus_pyrenoidosus.AAC.84
MFAEDALYSTITCTVTSPQHRRRLRSSWKSCPGRSLLKTRTQSDGISAAKLIYGRAPISHLPRDSTLKARSEGPRKLLSRSRAECTAPPHVEPLVRRTGGPLLRCKSSIHQQESRQECVAA